MSEGGRGGKGPRKCGLGGGLDVDNAVSGALLKGAGVCGVEGRDALYGLTGE